MKKIAILITVITALLFNAVAGVVFGTALGLSPAACAVGANVLSLIFGAFAPSVSLCAGVLRELWTGELIKALRAGDVATWLDGIPDYSQYADNDVIHLVDVGADPDVLINNTTYPIEVQALSDGDAIFSLDKFQTKATSITDDELYASSYDKMSSVKDRHADAIKVGKFKKAAHAFAPSSDGTKTPVLATTGDYESGTSGRRRLVKADIVRLKDKFDKMEVPTEGRRLVLCTDHVNDLLLIDQKFAEQYYNYTTGKIANMFGFEVYEYVSCPYYSTSGTKKALGATVGTGEYQASFAFYTKRAFKSTGSTKMYYSEAKTDPENQRSLINFRHMFVALPKKQEAIAAIYSAYTAPATTTDSDSGTGA